MHPYRELRTSVIKLNFSENFEILSITIIPTIKKIIKELYK